MTVKILMNYHYLLKNIRLIQSSEPIDEHFQKLKKVYSSINNVILEKVAISDDEKISLFG